MVRDLNFSSRSQRWLGFSSPEVINLESYCSESPKAGVSLRSARVSALAPSVVQKWVQAAVGAGCKSWLPRGSTHIPPPSRAWEGWGTGACLTSFLADSWLLGHLGEQPTGGGMGITSWANRIDGPWWGLWAAVLVWLSQLWQDWFPCPQEAGREGVVRGQHSPPQRRDAWAPRGLRMSASLARPVPSSGQSKGGGSWCKLL